MILADTIEGASGLLSRSALESTQASPQCSAVTGDAGRPVTEDCVEDGIEALETLHKPDAKTFISGLWAPPRVDTLS
jgi:hypothetical protein